MYKANKIISFSFLGFIILLNSCSNYLERDEFVAYVTNPENGLRKDQEIGNFELSAIYEPIDYIIEREFDKQEDNNVIEERKTELAEYEHFQFRIKLSEGGNILKYRESDFQNESSRVNHFSFNAKNDFKIISGKDTSYCKIVHYSRNYNLTPTIDLSLTFNKLEKKENIQLVYEDEQFDIGKVKFLFKKEDLGEIPELKL